MPVEQNEESLETRYSEEWRPVREGGGRFQGVPPRRTDRQLPWGPLLAAAAVGFVLALVFGPSRSSDPRREQEFANLESELQIARDRAGKLESELSSTREGVGKADAPEERRASEPEPQAAPAPEPTANREAATREAEPPPAVAPAVARTPTPSAPPEPSRTEPDQVALAESQGSFSVYADPDPASPIVRSTSRSGTSGAAVQVLAPQRAGWTTKAQPTLYWHASEGMQSAGEFTLTREGEDEPLVRGKLSAPDGAGIQRIDLSESRASLDEGSSYRWTVSYGDPEGSEKALATGGIRRVAPPDATPRAAPLTERLDALERAGLWYDAFDLVIRSTEDNSGAKNLAARRDAMLARVGIQLPSS